MKTLLIIAVVIVTAIFAGCSKTNELVGDTTFKLNDTLELVIDKSAVNNENQLTITIDSVLNDSRCPGNAICVWAGNAAVRFLFVNNETEHKFVLNTHGGTSFPQDTLLDGYAIRLVNLNPYPMTTNEIKQEDYIAELLITKIQ
jgi:hypothetical protein